MSKRFGILSENNENQKQKKKDSNQNLNKDNIFKSTTNNRFSSLNDEPTIINNNINNTNNTSNTISNKLKDNKVKEKKQDNRFQILMETNEADEVKVSSFSSEKKKYVDIHIEFVKEEKQEQDIIVNETLFPTLGLANNNISKQSAVDFKTKLLSNEAPVIEKKVEVKIITLSEEKEKELANKRLLKQVNKAMCEIVTKMVANGERQRQFYDSIYGNGAYDWEYEKVVDKYEVLYGKDTWIDYYNGEFIYEYSSDSDYENKYEYDNDTNKYDIDVDYNKKCSNWL
jgi:hypothetical protein